MKLAVVAAVGSYTPEDLEHKKRSLRTVLRPDTHLDMFVADSGVPYVESSLELYLSEVAVARKVVEVAGMGYDAVVGTAFLDNGLDAARELVDIPVVGPAKTTMYMAATLAHKFGVITAAGDLPRHIWALAKLLGVADRVVGIPTLKCTVADFLHDAGQRPGHDHRHRSAPHGRPGGRSVSIGLWCDNWPGPTYSAHPGYSGARSGPDRGEICRDAGRSRPQSQ